MAIKQPIRYLRSKGGRVVEVCETRKLYRADAIKFKCLDCAGGFTAEVRECELSDCPLHGYRPYQRKEN